MSNTATFPWPPKECNPNARVHYMVLAKARAEYRKICFYETKAQKMQAPKFNPVVHVEFYPPNKNRRDADNALASIKAGIDGMAQALGIDDSIFTEYRLSMKKGGHVCGGYVIVTLRGE